MQKPLQAHRGASGKRWIIALSFEFCNDALVLLWGMPSAQFYLNPPITPFTGKNKSSEGFFQGKHSVRVSFPCWQTAHYWAAIRFCSWKKIKTTTTILHSKEQNFILALHEFWPQSNNFVCSSEPWWSCLTVLSDNIFCAASCDFWIESHCNNLNTADGHFNFYTFSYTGFWIQYLLQIVTLKKNSIKNRDLFLVLFRLFLTLVL